MKGEAVFAKLIDGVAIARTIRSECRERVQAITCRALRLREEYSDGKSGYDCQGTASRHSP